MKWPLVTRKTAERMVLEGRKDALKTAFAVNRSTTAALVQQIKETRAAQRGLMRLQRKMRQLKSAGENHEP